MKKILIGTAISIVVMFSWALQDSTSKYKNINPSPSPDTYCLTMKGGKEVVITKGFVLNNDVHLRNGALLRANGEIVNKNGTHIKLKQEECVDQDGNIIQKEKTNG